jgi:hypothetical protein
MREPRKPNGKRIGRSGHLSRNRMRRLIAALVTVGALALGGCGGLNCACSANPVESTTTTTTCKPPPEGGACGVYKRIPYPATTITVP